MSLQVVENKHDRGVGENGRYSMWDLPALFQADVEVEKGPLQNYYPQYYVTCELPCYFGEGNTSITRYLDPLDFRTAKAWYLSQNLNERLTLNSLSM